MIDYLTNSLFNSHFIQQKGIHVLVMLEYNTRQKKKTEHNKVTSGSNPSCGLICESDVCTGLVPERGSHDGVSNPQ